MQIPDVLMTKEIAEALLQQAALVESDVKNTLSMVRRPSDRVYYQNKIDKVRRAVVKLDLFVEYCQPNPS